MTLNISQANIAELIGSVAKIEEKWKGKNSKSINLIQSMAWDSNTREEAHSRILADLLEIPFIKESFMNELLKDFGGFDNCDTYKPIREQGKIDVQLYSEKKIIIIENKINAATEQKSQIARYVIDYANEKKNFDFKNVYVVYLNPDTHSLPSDQSLTYNDGTKVYDRGRIDLKKQFKVLSYKDDITKWLKEIKNRKEAQEESLLLSALEQYIYYLEVKFKNTDMNRDIEKVIDEIFHLDNEKTNENKYNRLRQIAEEDMPKLYEYLKSYKIKLAKDLVDKWLNEVKEKCKGVVLLEDEEHTIDTKLNFADIWFTIKYSTYDDGVPCWFFWDNTKNPEERSKNREKCKEILNKARIEYEQSKDDTIRGQIINGINGADLFTKVYNAAKECGYIN